MSVLIKGMDMPECGERIIVLTSSGFVENVSGQVIKDVEAVPVPPHGDLIDRDALEYHADNVRDPMGRTEKTVMWSKIQSAPTVIPAESEGE